MARNNRRRPTGVRRATFAAVALMLGGGGLVAANVYASATESWGGGSGANGTGHVLSTGMATIDCPDVGSRLTAVPDAARSDVDRELALLDRQTAAAYRQLQQSGQATGQAAGSVDATIMNPLKEQRAAAIGRIADAVDRVGERPQGLDDLAACTLRPGDGAGAGAGAQATASPTGGAQQTGAGQGGNGPVVSDYADITSVQPGLPAPAQQAGASRGTFSSSCGVNANGLFNSDNVIVAPGVSNGAHHFHDYVGNQGNNAFASDDDLARAGTSCADQGDKSTYYWPVLRLQNGTQERDAASPGGGTEGNAGQIVTPKQVTLTFVGNPRDKVTAMPRFLRVITGDAKAFVNGPGNANASWSCTGYEDRQLKDKYPLCPPGSDVVRSFRFQSCWDGRNIDSANHRTHVAFTAPDGSCPAGFRAIPQLVQRIVYDVKAPSLQDGGRTVPLFAVDSFPEQLHKPVTDHGDFINVFDEDLMREMVDCINSGRTCGPGGDGSGTTPAPTASSGTGTTTAPGGGTTEQPGGTATAAPAPTASGPTASGPTEKPRTDATITPHHPTRHDQPTPQDRPTRQGRPAEQHKPTDQGSPAQQDRSTSPAPSTRHHGTGKQSGSTGPAPATSAPDQSAPVQSPPTPSAPAQATAAGHVPPATAQPEPQGGQGALAQTGAHLWPAALGILLALSGLIMLLRARRLRY
ncbi:membrane protein [Streptomyces filipinensis]|uniref:Membrane protein n=2 Tax=Streptomyces filipinensis TaxID=66887 RepID=A0A918MBS9_9ACTN|nr:membrane protein [Streptomyces filipinensis]